MSDVAQHLIAKGVDPGAVSEDGVTALIAAASEGHAEIVQKLVQEAGASPDQADAKGLTALMAAAVRGHKDVVLALLKHGANVQLQDASGLTALDHANKGLKAITELLEQYSHFLTKARQDSRVFKEALESHKAIVAALTEAANPAAAEAAAGDHSEL
eukprot:TRINITY_DN1589_c0_g1_i2.p1 TRINITY_DN1589_c0_g1~~TRINITY_DN1589_c0_g1_i2.p1  ORF type:complete len:158 (-),score=55.05 TRINITY_DN1589_c0_g1_i2:114-587(-)